jgi:uncharacterized protein YehS (DUF1456 family)
MNENEKSEKETIESWLKENDVEEFIKEHAPKETVLSEANRIIYGDREKTYGHPAKNLTTTANFWGEYLGTKITAKDVCVMMMLLKIARLRNDINHRDSVVDTCGYAALIERCDE